MLYVSRTRLTSQRLTLNSLATQVCDPPWQEFPTSTLDRITRIREWLHWCDESHPACKTNVQWSLPKRLIDLMPAGDVSARLVLTQDIGSSQAVYAALSYCWGDAQMLKTNKTTMDRHLASLPMDRIPTTIADAFTITRGLGLRYIWVDALCILQDDQDEWNHEAGSMHDIFEGSHLTLLAAEADSAAGGLFAQGHRESVDKACYDRVFLDARIEDGRSLRIHICPVRSERTALRGRGWTLQEDFLSRRTVQLLNSELIWRCRCSRRQEIVPGDDPLKYSYGIHDPIQGTESPDETWRSLLADYSCRRLSFPGDRLPALTGLVGFFQSLRQDECLLGLWQKSLARDLMWKRTDTVAERPLQPSAAQALPSWSPLSCRQSVEFDAWFPTESRAQLEWCLETAKCDVVWNAKEWLSPLHSTSLTVRGPTRDLFLAEVTSIPDCNPPYFDVDEENIEESGDPLPWRCAVQWDSEGYRSPRKWRCILLQRKTVHGFELGGETFLVLDAADNVSSLPCYRRVGIGSLGRHRPIAPLGAQTWKFDLGEQEEIALV